MGNKNGTVVSIVVFQQMIGFPMGTNCASQLTNLFLHACKADFLKGHLTKININL